MGRPKGTQKTGGRKAGTPNKVTTTTRQALQQYIDTYFGDLSQESMFWTDIQALDPKDRMAITEKFIAYALPKPQSVSLDINSTETTATVTEMLRVLSGIAEPE